MILEASNSTPIGHASFVRRLDREGELRFSAHWGLAPGGGGWGPPWGGGPPPPGGPPPGGPPPGGPPPGMPNPRPGMRRCSRWQAMHEPASCSWAFRAASWSLAWAAWSRSVAEAENVAVEFGQDSGLPLGGSSFPSPATRLAYSLDCFWSVPQSGGSASSPLPTALFKAVGPRSSFLMIVPIGEDRPGPPGPGPARRRPVPRLRPACFDPGQPLASDPHEQPGREDRRKAECPTST